VVVEKLDLAWWQVVSTRLEQGEALVTAHLITPNQLTARWVWRNQDLCYASPAPRTVSLPADVPTLAQIALQQRQTQVIETQGLRFLLDVHLPKPHLIVIGGAHVAISLQHLAQALGFRMTLIDPRRTFATQERFPLVEQIVHHYPSKAFEEIPLTPDTYLVVLTHDSKIDDPTLAIALDSPVRYIGVMSSRKTHTKRLARLREKGFTEAQLSRIHAPIGLNIPTQTPEEIALSIMAEIIASKNSSHDHRISPLS
jgi:xanthine dehydrogenase accessory factor